MADKQVSQLPQVGSIDDAALFLLEQGGTAYKATAAQIKALAPDSGTADLTGAVRYDESQSLSADEQTQARSNIGAVSSTEMDSAINTAISNALGDYSTAWTALDELIGGQPV